MTDNRRPGRTDSPSRAPGYQLHDNPMPPRVDSRDHAYHYQSTENDPLATYSSPRFDDDHNNSTANTSAFSDAPYGHGGSLDLSDAYVTDHTYPAVRTESASTHNSRSALRNDKVGVPVSGSATPLHPGSTLQMREASRPSSRDRSYGEKGEYRSPRNRSHDRLGSAGGLGNWSGPAPPGTSPYGPLGSNQPPNSGLQSAASSSGNLQFADTDSTGPPASNAFSRFVFAIYDSSFIVRWITYLVPVLALLWIPGIVGLTAAPNATIWTVPLVWWSAWLSVVWAGWWGAALVAKMGPWLLTRTLGIIAPELKHYIAYVKAIQFYVGAAAWALANWVSFLPLIRNNATQTTSVNTLILITQFLFGVFLCLIILLIEKLVIQIIAHNFHKKSYEDRINNQKFQIQTLVSLYVNTKDIGRSDTLDNGGGLRPKNKRQQSDPTLLVKNALKGVKKVAQATTTVIGTVASEFSGERVLQPNSPGSMVIAALASTNKSKQLARRIYFSFCPSYRSALLLEDISRCFTNREAAEQAFAVFDRDTNGDASLEEIESAVLEVHRERLALSRSMRDIDSAVGRLDNIIMSLWYVVSVLILAGLMNASFNTMITSAGTLILGLSWLIGTTAQEILASIIFLFIKHAYDVGDRVEIDGFAMIVLEMALLSTTFKRIDGTSVQVPHSILNTKFINNIRRSGAIWEAFPFDVAFETPFEKIEALRARMLEFLEQERRDFIPAIDITVQDFAGQGKMTLSANINYKSNYQNGALKAQRRNKWICALKTAMASLEIYGPADAGNPAPAPADPIAYTQVPYVAADKKDDKTTSAEPSKADVMKSGAQATAFTDPREVIDEEGGELTSADRKRL